MTLAENLAVEREAKTLIHEIAHIELRYVEDVDQYRAHRERMEVEAESVAFIVAGLTGFGTSAHSVGYITGWADEETTIGPRHRLAGPAHRPRPRRNHHPGSSPPPRSPCQH